MTDRQSLRLGVAVITMGDRRARLIKLLDSVKAQEGEPALTVVVGQGVPLPGLPDGVHAVELPQNLGIPGGPKGCVAWLRDRGGVDVLVVLDDDGLPDPHAFEMLRQQFALDPGLGIVSFRIVDEQGQSARRHVPRLGGVHPERSRGGRRAPGLPSLRIPGLPTAGTTSSGWPNPRR